MTKARALWTRVSNLCASISLSKAVKSQLSTDMVVLSAPSGPMRLVWRCRLTIALVSLDLARIALLSQGSRLGLVALAAFAASLEYLAGTGATAWCFGFSLATGALAHWPAHSWRHGFEFSLGALGCGGGLFWFLRHRWYVLGAAVGLAALARFAFQDPRTIPCLVAFGAGIWVMKAYLTYRNTYH